MKRRKKENSQTNVSKKKKIQDQTLQKQLVTQITRLCLMLAVTLIVVSGIFMYFSNRNTLHEMTNVALLPPQ